MTSRRGFEQPVLDGYLTTLRPWEPSDAEAVFAACQDAEIQHWTAVPSPYTYADAIEFVTTYAVKAWADGGAAFAVIEKRSGLASGSVGVHGVTDGAASIGYWTSPEARRRGLAVDAVRTLSRWLLSTEGVDRVEALVELGNAASVGVVRSAGFSDAGRHERITVGGRLADGVIFRLTRA